MKKIIKIDGMGCQKCVAHVKEALENLDGVDLLEVKIGEASVDIPEGYDFKKIVEALDDAGYEVEE
ncbi:MULTISPECIES: heavy-metal-associated domain-containing protein [Fusobacterium]|jgi:copper chaperone|uniref:ATPase P n=1 Tax=Fusobacterium varium ATCC 27725 TaxID=469618 RepID=A0ABM6U479_FUSVA|nr:MULTISPECIES: heavy metal-associated domain-containing protein [Fusobacterium]AVQ31144.1 ATPase P [Fusobacterium varium ATCC 27725]EES62458.1 heavy metal-associated domain protein [Fusobacterium varium ATCC 27725]MCD7980527.1 heavy-metal-associated domain-containing protein [Fusobacterium sp.]MCF0171286.1 heavy-metal-associated domain-containing protein [Fusobacterium varium]MCF2673265.1 heavy-metal-associated domain-containing protein [Fusobacterium varium]